MPDGRASSSPPQRPILPVLPLRPAALAPHGAAGVDAQARAGLLLLQVLGETRRGPVVPALVCARLDQRPANPATAEGNRLGLPAWGERRGGLCARACADRQSTSMYSRP